MKDYRQKLLLLLYACADDRSEAKKLQYLASIIRSDGYEELRDISVFHTEYIKSYSIEQLEKLEPSELKKRRRDIAAITEMFRLLQRAILFGNAPDLNEKDAPVFDDMQTIKNLSCKLSVGDSVKNYTNIDGNDCMKIFDSATVKSPKTCFDLLPLSSARKTQITEKDIVSALGSQPYCVNISRLQAVHDSFLSFSARAEKTLRQERQRRKKHRLFKASVVMLLYGVLFGCIQFELFASADLPLISLLFLLSTVVFIIWG